MKRLQQILVAAAAFLILGFAAGAQQAPPPKTETAKPKAKRVWTNDDVTTLRQPSDDYAEEKSKQAEEAAAKQKADSEKAATQAPGGKQKAKPKDYLPKTAEEAQKQVAAKQYEIEMQYEAIELVKKEQAQATTDEARQGFQKRIDTLTATLEESIAELRTLDARLQELKSNPPPAPPQPAAPVDASAPTPVEQLEKQIAEKQEKIEHNSEYVQPLRDAIAKADSETTRESLQKKLDGFLALLDKQNAELKTLESQLQELKSKPPAPKP